MSTAFAVATPVPAAGLQVGRIHGRPQATSLGGSAHLAGRCSSVPVIVSGLVIHGYCRAKRRCAMAATKTHHRRPVPQAAPAGSAEAWRERHWFPIASTLELDPKRPTPVRLDGLDLVVWQEAAAEKMRQNERSQADLFTKGQLWRSSGITVVTAHSCAQPVVQVD
eukprot:Skav207210  [mRNA]  locus=scaffold1244:100628:108623:+ [translate_table: standard]